MINSCAKVVLNSISIGQDLMIGIPGDPDLEVLPGETEERHLKNERKLMSQQSTVKLVLAVPSVKQPTCIKKMLED